MYIVEIDELRSMLSSVTGESLAVESLTEHSPLLGAIPELDSLAIVNLLVNMEQRYNFQVDDDEVEQSIFQNLGSLRDFAQLKIARLSANDSSSNSNNL